MHHLLSTLTLILCYTIIINVYYIQANNVSGWETFEAIRSLNQPISPVTIEVTTKSSLYVQRGQSAVIYFDVTNSNDFNQYFYFYCNAQFSTVQSIQPYEKWIFGLDKVTVKVNIEVSNIASRTETITFTAVTVPDEEQTISKAYLFISQQVTDSSCPDINYSIIGDCSQSNKPSTCESGTWGFQATVQDKQSGLLTIKTVPKGFIFSTDFIAGTREPMTGRYTTSCCIDRVDVVTTDVNGNWCSISIDINNVWLSAGAITAIVLGCILVLILVILLCCLLVFCIKKRQSSSSFTVSSR